MPASVGAVPIAPPDVAFPPAKQGMSVSKAAEELVTQSMLACQSPGLSELLWSISATAFLI